MRFSFSSSLFYLCLFTLPWVGVGVIRFFTGRDVGGGLQPSWLFLALAILIWCSSRIQGQSLREFWESSRKLPSSLVLITVGAILAVAISGFGISHAVSTETLATAWGRWTRQLIQLLIMFAFFWWAALWVRGNRRWQLTLDFLFLGAIFQILYSLFQGLNFYHPIPVFSQLEVFFTSNPSILSGSEKLYLNNVLLETPRLRGTVCEPLYLGNFLLMAWPFLLVWQRPVWMRIVLGTLLAVLLVLTWSRGAWLGFVAQCFLWGSLFLILRARKSVIVSNSDGKKRLRFFPWGFVIAVLILPVVDLLSGGLLLQRLMAIFNNQDWSNLTRLYSMKAAWLAFLESPVVGVGWGQFAFHFPLLVDPMGLQSQFSWPVVNNFPLQILCETGLIGFGLFAWGCLFFFRKIGIVMKSCGNSVSNMSMVFPAAIAVWGVWIQLLSFSQYNLPHIWIGLGLLFAAVLEQPGRPSDLRHEDNSDES